MKDYIKNKITKGVLALIGAMILTGCAESFLEPDPLSFYEPETTFTTESGLQATMAMADRHLRLYWTNYTANNILVPIGTEYLFSDMSIYGKTDAGGGIFDNIAYKLTPTGGAGSNDSNHIMYFWDQTYTGIKYANTVLTYIDNVKDIDEQTKNTYKGRAYFHRAFRYYSLVFQFGDVPLITKILEVPKQNYRTTKKEAILEMIVKDLEFAIEWVPKQKDMDLIGMVNKEACHHLLIKCYLAIGEFKKAEEQADILINQSGLSLMRDPFGVENPGGEPETWSITRNVIWDLHRPENKLISENKEVIMGMPNSGEQSFTQFLTMRIFGPFWSDGNTKTPDGKNAIINYARNHEDYKKSLDFTRAMGRGIATVSSTYFATHTLWNVNDVQDDQDLRHNVEVGNWVRMEDLKYNDPSSKYFGENLQLYHPETGAILCPDTIRNWFDLPLYKIYLQDVIAEENMGVNQFNGATKGGNAHWYLYRLAETYLLRAEARFYQGNVQGATSDVNEVRKRAKCTELYTAVTIGDIVNERARELYLEEWRNVELTRVSRCLAISGKPDEWGNTYDINTYDKQQGTDFNGGSYWYQRIMHYTPYNKGEIKVRTATLKYTMDKCNLYWPIPNSAITANNKGQLHQNFGYDGYDPNIPMWESWEEAVEDEDKVN